MIALRDSFLVVLMMTRPLSLRLGQPDDDYVSTFEGAARRNFIDADNLRRSSRRAAAIYLYGYSVEMNVKAAYFRNLFQATGAPPGTRITGQLRRQEADTWQAIHASRKPTPHDIEGWANLLVRKRVSLGMAHAGALATEIINRAASVYLMWREYMRYRVIRILDPEVKAVRSDALWFRRNYAAL